MKFLCCPVHDFLCTIVFLFNSLLSFIQESWLYFTCSQLNLCHETGDVSGFLLTFLGTSWIVLNFDLIVYGFPFEYFEYEEVLVLCKWLPDACILTLHFRKYIMHNHISLKYCLLFFTVLVVFIATLCSAI